MAKSKADSKWLDAPTSGGLWWFAASKGGETEIVEICRSSKGGPIARFVGTNDELTLGAMKGRWFGPVVPPP